MTSPILNAKRAAERHLNTLSPALPIAYESTAFNPPTGMYLRTQFVVNTPDDPVIGDKYYRERITFQVFVAAETNKGTAEAFTVAESIRALFSKGTTFSEAGNTIYVLNTPQISGSVLTSDRLVVPIMINLVVEVFS